MRWRWRYLAVVLAAVISGCSSHGEPAGKEETKKEDGEAHVTVRAEPARVGALTESVEGLGRCEALPDHFAMLTPAVEGHVHALLAAEGDAVKKGQPIVELDRAVAEADLAEKTATRDGLKVSLALLQSLPRAEERKANELAIEQAKLAVEEAQMGVDRLKPLLARHDVSEQQLFVAQKALETAQIHQRTAESTLRVMTLGPRPEAVAEAESKIKTADMAVAFSKAHLDFHTIRAPIDGVLESLTCHPGQTIAIGGPIGEVVDTRQVFAAIWLAPRTAARVHVGLAARVFAAETREQGGESNPGIEGKVAFVGRVADPQTGNLPVHVLVDNPKALLTVGESVRVLIVIEERKDVLQVPSAAILDLGEGPVLNVVRDGKVAVLHPEVGSSQAGWIEVKGVDLKGGEPVIIEGGYNLPDKTAVKIAEAKAEEDDHEKAEGKHEEGKDKEQAKEKAEEKAEGKEKASGAKPDAGKAEKARAEKGEAKSDRAPAKEEAGK